MLPISLGDMAHMQLGILPGRYIYAMEIILPQVLVNALIFGIGCNNFAWLAYGRKIQRYKLGIMQIIINTVVAFKVIDHPFLICITVPEMPDQQG